MYFFNILHLGQKEILSNPYGLPFVLYRNFFKIKRETKVFVMYSIIIFNISSGL